MSRPCACVYCNDPCQVPEEVKDAICPACRAARETAGERLINYTPGDEGECHR